MVSFLIIFYVGQGIQEWTKPNLWKTAFKKFEGMWYACLRRPYPFKCFKSCLNFTFSILEYFVSYSIQDSVKFLQLNYLKMILYESNLNLFLVCYEKEYSYKAIQGYRNSFSWHPTQFYSILSTCLEKLHLLSV